MFFPVLVSVNSFIFPSNIFHPYYKSNICSEFENISRSLGCFGSGDQLAEKVSPSRGAHMSYLREWDKVEDPRS